MMLIPKVYLSKELNNEDLYEIVKDGLGIGEVKEVQKDLNNVELITEWSRFELRLKDRELSIRQRWNKGKMPIVIVIIIVSLFIWVPFLYLAYKMYKERQISKEIINKIGEIVNNN